MTTLICSTCSDPIEVTATSVVLPFVCLKCEESIKDFEKMLDDSETDKTVEEFYDAMTPASESDAGLLEPGTKTEVASPEDFATVENTTLLIQDLEKQLATARELAADRLKEIEYVEETHELSLAFGRAIIARLSEAFADLKAELVSERSQRTHWQREEKITSTLLLQELDKSLWTRFKEATFDRL